MKEPRGYVKTARKAFDAVHGDVWWLEPRTFSKWEAWQDLIQLAQWRDFRHVTAHGPVELKRGEFVASLRWLGQRWNWSPARVLRFCDEAEKLKRIAKQRTERAGTVYLIVKYDHYQGTESDNETPSETLPETPAKQQRNKNKKVKQLKQTETTGTDPEDPVVRFPVAACNALFDRWVQRRGSVNYGLLRNTLLPFFPAVGPMFTEAQLLAAIDVFAELAEVDRPEFSHKWDVRKFGAELPRWVKLGALDYVDGWGLPTERGTLLKLFDTAQPRYVA